MDKREHAQHSGGRPQAKGYSEAGASWSRRALRSFTPNSGSPREDIDWNNMTLRQRGRMLYMASPVAAAAVNTNRTKVVGSGLALKCAPGREALGLGPEAAREWQRRTEGEFALWAGRKESCDATCVNNLEGMQQLAVKSWLMSGDVFAVVKRRPATPSCPYSLRLHLVEADRVATPPGRGAFAEGATDGENEANGNKIHDGVEVGPDGAIAAYHIRNTYPWQASAGPTEWARVEAFGERTGLPGILHVMDSERPDQYRGVSYLAQVVEPLLQLRRYTESELMAALVQSFFTAWVETGADPAQLPFNEVGDDSLGPGESPGEGPGEGPKGADEYGMGPGTVLHLQPGEKVVFGSPNVPAAGFDGFVKTLCRMVGAALELPYDVLIKEYNSSYSASRGALMDAWEAFRMRRKWFVDDFCQPVYELWLAEAVALGRVDAPGFFGDPLARAAWCGARWMGPVQSQLDPVKEAKAAVIYADRAFKTHEQLARELGGGDWGENVEQLGRENGALMGAGGGNYMASLESDPEAGGGDEGKME